MRVLIVRFSSFGDIFQALEAAAHLSRRQEVTQIGWLVRDDFGDLLQNQPAIDSVYRFGRRDSLIQLIALAWTLGGLYDHVYDAHSSIRSHIVSTVIRLRWILTGEQGRSLIRRSKERWRRFLFFKLRRPSLPVPYRGAESFLRPLRSWFGELNFDFRFQTWSAPETAASEKSILGEFARWKGLSARPVIALAPSAAWPNKRWPMERWADLIQISLNAAVPLRFLLLGGPDDRHLEEIVSKFGLDNVFSAIGRSTLLESADLIAHVDGFIGNDTGLLHVADRLQVPSVAIIGPTAFGYTVSPASRIAEVARDTLSCKPCSKDGRDACTNRTQLKCLLDISVGQVLIELRRALELRQTPETVTDLGIARQ